MSIVSNWRRLSVGKLNCPDAAPLFSSPTGGSLGEMDLTRRAAGIGVNGERGSKMGAECEWVTLLLGGGKLPESGSLNRDVQFE